MSSHQNRWCPMKMTMTRMSSSQRGWEGGEYLSQDGGAARAVVRGERLQHLKAARAARSKCSRCSQPLRRSTTPALPAAANRTDFYSQGFNLIFSDDSLSRSCPLDPLNFWTRTSCPNFLWSQATKTDKDKDKDKP